MATLTATEQGKIVTEAVVRRPEKPEGPQGFKTEEARRLRKRIDEADPRTVLEELRQRKPVENPKAQHLIERNIAGTKNPDGTVKRSPDQQRRYEEAQRFNNLAQSLIEKGIDRLPPDQQKIAIDQVRGILQKLPEAETLWWRLSPEQIKDEISRILKDPDFVAKVREIRGERTDESNLISIDLAATQAKFETVKAKKGHTEAELDRNNGERQGVDARLEQFEDRTTTGGKKGAKLEELETLEAEAPGLTAKLEETKALYEEAKDNVRNFQSIQLQVIIKSRGETPDLTTQVAQQRAEAQKLLNEITTITNGLNRREVLQRERAELLERRGQLETQRIELQKAADDTNQEFSQAQVELEGASHDRTFAEEEFVAGLKNTLRDATFEYLTDKVASAETTLTTMLDEEIKQTNDKAEKALLAGVKSRYIGRPQRQKAGGIFGIGVKEIWVPGQLKTEIIDADYQEYLGTGNPMPIVQSLLEAGRDPITGESLLTAEEIKAKLADEQFIQKWGTRAIEEMLRARLKSGEITENEAQIIVGHEWGAAAIQEAIHKNPQAQDQLEELKAQTGEKDERKLLTKLKAKSLLMLLLMILGSAVVSTLRGVNMQEALKEAA